MLLVLIRGAAVVIGTLLFLPAFVYVPNAIAQGFWAVGSLAFMCGLFGAWLICAGWYGTLNGRPKQADSSSPARMPNTR